MFEKEPVQNEQRKEEDKMEEKYTWNLTDIFKTKEEFEKEIEKLNETLNVIKTYQGKLFNSSENIYQCYRNYEKALEYYEKIYFIPFTIVLRIISFQ